MGYVANIVNRCLSFDDETEWFEYKKGTAVSSTREIGEYISALSNGAVMRGEPFGYLIWGIHNNRLNLGDTPQDTPQGAETVSDRILAFCSEARSVQEILSYLELRDRKNLMTHIRALVESGRLARTIPDKPSSKNQKYITIR